MIQIENLSFAYPQKEVLKDINLTVSPADFCALIGPNGSGKSTLLKAIAGLLSPQTNSKIALQHQFISNLTAMEMAKILAYVPQHQDIVFDYPVFDTILMGRFPHQNHWSTMNKKDADIVEEVMYKTNLTHLRNRMLGQLSGGELQRTMIARAMAQQTPILLLDEPLSNLDITHKYEIMDILKKLNQNERVTIIIILHEFSFVKRYANQTLILNDGKIQNYGPTQEVFNIENLQTAFHLSSEYFIDQYGTVIKR
ncbi:MAG: ABC transporter ATP-binding protein [Bacteroidales bacterium]|nr:ABC transporter ATP-binding protein [Bacteroidales bacterium]